MSRVSSYPTGEWLLVALNGLGVSGRFKDLPSLLSSLKEELGDVELRDRITQEDVEGRGRRAVVCGSNGRGTIFVLLTGDGELEIAGIARRVTGEGTAPDARA